jgi:hypothetical protein
MSILNKKLDLDNVCGYMTEEVKKRLKSSKTNKVPVLCWMTNYFNTFWSSELFSFEK